MNAYFMNDKGMRAINEQTNHKQQMLLYFDILYSKSDVVSSHIASLLE